MVSSGALPFAKTILVTALSAPTSTLHLYNLTRSSQMVSRVAIRLPGHTPFPDITPFNPPYRPRLDANDLNPTCNSPANRNERRFPQEAIVVETRTPTALLHNRQANHNPVSGGAVSESESANKDFLRIT